MDGNGMCSVKGELLIAWQRSAMKSATSDVKEKGCRILVLLVGRWWTRIQQMRFEVNRHLLPTNKRGERTLGQAVLERSYRCLECIGSLAGGTLSSTNVSVNYWKRKPYPTQVLQIKVNHLYYCSSSWKGRVSWGWVKTLGRMIVINYFPPITSNSSQCAWVHHLPSKWELNMIDPPEVGGLFINPSPRIRKISREKSID